MHHLLSQGSWKSPTFSVRLLASLLVVVGTAHAAEHIVLGRAVELPPPQEDCVLGRTSAEREFVEQFRSLTAFSGRVLQVAVPCADVERAASGAIQSFPTVTTVRVIAARGQLRIENRSRSQFLAALGDSETIDIGAANRHVAAALASTDITVSLSSATPLGRDSVAAYWATVGSAKVAGGSSRKTVSVFAAVLINGLPLSVQKTVTEGISDSTALASSVQQYVQQIIVSNER